MADGKSPPLHGWKTTRICLVPKLFDFDEDEFEFDFEPEILSNGGIHLTDDAIKMCGGIVARLD